MLSGLYGMLAPFDAVVPYRLEMGSKLQVAGARDLYGFWGDAVYDALAQETDAVINLASVEYAKVVTPFFEKGGAPCHVLVRRSERGGQVRSALDAREGGARDVRALVRRARGDLGGGSRALRCGSYARRGALD